MSTKTMTWNRLGSRIEDITTLVCLQRDLILAQQALLRATEPREQKYYHMMIEQCQQEIAKLEHILPQEG